MRRRCPCGLKAVSSLREVTLEAQVELVEMWKDGVRQGAATQPINQWGFCCTAITDLGKKTDCQEPCSS